MGLVRECVCGAQEVHVARTIATATSISTEPKTQSPQHREHKNLRDIAPTLMLLLSFRERIYIFIISSRSFTAYLSKCVCERACMCEILLFMPVYTCANAPAFLRFPFCPPPPPCCQVANINSKAKQRITRKTNTHGMQ